MNAKTDGVMLCVFGILQDLAAMGVFAFAVFLVLHAMIPQQSSDNHVMVSIMISQIYGLSRLLESGLMWKKRG